MTKTIELNVARIKPRAIEEIVAVIADGGVVILPGDSGYSLLGQLGNKQVVSRIRQIRELDKEHPFTIVCSDLADLSTYAKVDNIQYRLLKSVFPGAFTCILPASREVPRLLAHDKRKTIGIRVPHHAVLQAVIKQYGSALMGVSLFDDANETVDIYDLDAQIANQVDLIVDVGALSNSPTTVLDLTIMPPEVIRQGVGDASAFI